MFLDDKYLDVSAGKGGDGAALFRREIYVPHGGPDGGDGGNGGNVYVVGRNNLHALSHMAQVHVVKAEDGAAGAHRRSTGKTGEDAEILVPLGTVVSAERDGGEVQLGEIVEEGQRLLVAKGGNGGWGNWHFRSSVQQAPDRANPGQPGEKLRLHLVLKLIAEVGLVGLPNAGKSTILSVISAARPKIANYPFTTLEPQLGVAELGTGEDRRQIVFADLPGLIEGASEGRGLGTTFLRHVERTRQIVHCLDASQSPEEILANYRTVRAELAGWSGVLAEKPELVVLTKIDLLSEEELAERRQAVERALGTSVVAISAATHRGLTDLLTRCI